MSCPAIDQVVGAGDAGRGTGQQERDEGRDLVGLGEPAGGDAERPGRLQRLAGAAILGGASANLIDRIGDDVVTDYLHTGWWPTFNLADTLLMLGMATVILTTLRDPVPAPRPRA